jgi:hypothetical protein
MKIVTYTRTSTNKQNISEQLGFLINFCNKNNWEIVRSFKDCGKSLFNANYKGKRIYISTDHGFGKPQYDHLKRFLIDVVDIKTGMYDVQSYQDCHTIRDAIIYALKGAMLVA